MRTFSLILSLVIVGATLAHAKYQEHDTLKYFNQLLVGGLFAKEVPLSFTSTMIHGGVVNRTRAGVGIAYDIYGIEWRTTSLLAMFSYDLSSNANQTLSLQFTGGQSYLKRLDTRFDGYNYEGRGGRLLQPALSYRLQSGKLSIHFVAGYRFQRMKYVQSIRWWPGDTGLKNYVTRDSDRIILQIGFGIR